MSVQWETYKRLGWAGGARVKSGELDGTVYLLEVRWQSIRGCAFVPRCRLLMVFPRVGQFRHEKKTWLESLFHPPGIPERTDDL